MRRGGGGCTWAMCFLTVRLCVLCGCTVLCSDEDSHYNALTICQPATLLFPILAGAAGDVQTEGRLEYGAQVRFRVVLHVT